MQLAARVADWICRWDPDSADAFALTFAWPVMARAEEDETSLMLFGEMAGQGY